jgi:hypothetical protein
MYFGDVATDSEIHLRPELFPVIKVGTGVPLLCNGESVRFRIVV